MTEPNLWAICFVTPELKQFLPRFLNVKYYRHDKRIELKMTELDQK